MQNRQKKIEKFIEFNLQNENWRMTEGATHLACDEVLVVHNSQDESIELPALRNPDSNKSNQQVSTTFVEVDA